MDKNIKNDKGKENADQKKKDKGKGKEKEMKISNS